jgi:hypothetical protein
VTDSVIWRYETSYTVSVLMQTNNVIASQTRTERSAVLSHCDPKYHIGKNVTFSDEHLRPPTGGTASSFFRAIPYSFRPVWLKQNAKLT